MSDYIKVNRVSFWSGSSAKIQWRSQLDKWGGGGGGGGGGEDIFIYSYSQTVKTINFKTN